jgi:hypothetical protein
VAIVARDWRGRWRHELAATGDAPARGVIEIAPSPAWRIHRFWWPTRVPYRVRLLRLELEAPGGAPARARLRYLGREPLPADGFAREVHAVALPDGGIAGGRGRIGLSVVNRGDWTWRTAGTLPVRLAVRLEPLDGGPASESRVALGRDVAAGERLDLGFDLDWPAAAGRYRLELDLLLEDVARFAERTGEPLARREITLRPAE